MKLAPVLLGTAAVGVFVVGATAQNPGTVPADRTPSPKPAKQAKVTYAQDVAPLLNQKCVSCHRPGEVAPFSLVGYENAKKWSGMIKGTAEKRIMPPWKAVHGYGEFLDENRLTDDQINVLRQWHEQGAPRGNGKQEPKPPTFSSEWTLGKPDLIISPSKPFKLDAEGEDVYRNFVIKTDYKEPVWITGMDVRPGNKKVVHHVIAFLDKAGASHKLADANTDGQEGYVGTGGGVGILPSGSLGGWAPGVRARHTPEGTAFRLDPGTTVVMQVHYHKSGKPEEDQTKIGLYVTKEAPKKEIDLHWMFNFAVNIQPGDKEYKLSRTYVFKEDRTIYGVMPHMHLLGRSMKSWLEFPDGKIQPLVHVDDWDFNWQLNYAFKQPIKVPAGSKQIVEAIYDNSSDNPRNPNNPPKRVTWGEGTNDEMFLLITAFTREAAPAGK